MPFKMFYTPTLVNEQYKDQYYRKTLDCDCEGVITNNKIIVNTECCYDNSVKKSSTNVSKTYYQNYSHYLKSRGIDYNTRSTVYSPDSSGEGTVVACYSDKNCSTGYNKITNTKYYSKGAVDSSLVTSHRRYITETTTKVDEGKMSLPNETCSYVLNRFLGKKLRC